MGLVMLGYYMIGVLMLGYYMLNRFSTVRNYMINRPCNVILHDKQIL